MPTGDTRVSVLGNIYDDLENGVKLLSILNREKGTVTPFDPSNFQKHYMHVRRTGRKRRLILKPRQIYASTIILAKNFLKTAVIPGTRCLEMTHEGLSTELFRQTVREWCQILDGVGLLPEVEQDNAEILSFKNTNSYMVFSTAGSKQGGRSTAYNTVHLSELAHYEVSDPYKLVQGIIPSIPADGELDIESTPNGVDGPFYDYYTDAKNGELDWDTIFWRWFDNPAYVREPESEVKFTTEEQKLVDMYGLSLNQIAWRRFTMSQMRRRRSEQSEGQRTMFHQEYPEDDISCFLAGSDTVIDNDALMSMIEWVQVPVLNKEGFDIWKAPSPRSVYVVGGDTSEGKKDYTAIGIMDARSQELVARYHGKVTPSTAAEIVNIGARIYNNALVNIETPGPGAVVLDRLQSYPLYYDNLFYYFDEFTGEVKDNPGWPQNLKTRTDMIDVLQTSSESLSFRVYDERTIRELASLTWKKVGAMRRARAEAGPGAHDDLVFMLGLCLMACPAALSKVRTSRGLHGEGNRVVGMGGGMTGAQTQRQTVKNGVHRLDNVEGILHGDLPLEGGQRVRG